MLESNQSPKRKPASVNSASSWLHSDSNDLGVCPCHVMVHWESCSEMHRKLSVGMMFANYNQSNSCFSQCHRKGLQVARFTQTQDTYCINIQAAVSFPHRPGSGKQGRCNSVTRGHGSLHQCLSADIEERSGLLVLCLNLFEYIYYCTHISQGFPVIKKHTVTVYSL